MQNVEASFDRVMQELERKSARYRGDIDGGGKLVEEQNVIVKNVEPAVDGATMTLKALHNGHLPADNSFGRFEDFPRKTTFEITPASLGLPECWQGYDAVKMRLENGDKPITVEFIVVGARGRITDRRDLAAGETAEFCIDLIDLPLVQGKLPEFEPTGIRLVFLWDGADVPHTVSVKEIILVPSADGKPKACVDAFGQRINADWPGKVRSIDDLRKKGEEEQAALASTPPVAERSRYGGWTGGERFDATGFFRVEQDSAGRWWYIDPEGWPFWSAGVTGVRYSDDTSIENREFLFAELPDRNGPFAEAYGSHSPLVGSGQKPCDTISFYRLNLLRKWGSFEAWRDHVVNRFKAWGYNTVANWSCELMMEQRDVPHVRSLGTRGPIECHIQGSFFDVFDARWEEFFNSQCEQAAAVERGNPWLIGYFVDNEKSWAREVGGMRLLAAAADAALRDEWLRLLQESFSTIEQMNSALGTAFPSWDAARGAGSDDVPHNSAGLNMLKALEDRYTETYFKKVRKILKHHDPDHLYLGCRFIRQPPRREIVEIAGKYCDVMSVNCYSLLPEKETFDKWYKWSGRPVQIGEHQLSMYGPRQLPQLWTTFTAEERREFYPKFEEAFASLPYSVGSHWFQYADQCITGRPSNGENQIIGMVDITDAPHPEMSEAVRIIGENIYNWHMKSV